MKELDLVESLVKIENIEVGTQGVIVHVYEGHNACEHKELWPFQIFR